MNRMHLLGHFGETCEQRSKRSFCRVDGGKQGQQLEEPWMSIHLRAWLLCFLVNTSQMNPRDDYGFRDFIFGRYLSPGEHESRALIAHRNDLLFALALHKVISLACCALLIFRRVVEVQRGIQYASSSDHRHCDCMAADIARRFAGAVEL